MKKKWLTFSAGIIGVTACTMFIISNIMACIGLDSLLGYHSPYYGSAEITTYMAFAAVMTILTIIPLALNACGINALSDIKYKKAYPTIITAIVFNFIFLISNLVLTIGFAISEAFLAISIIGLILIFACNILYFVEFALNSNKKIEDKAITTASQKQDANYSEEQLLNELEKLVSLREKKVISQEELILLKKQIMEKYTIKN